MKFRLAFLLLLLLFAIGIFWIVQSRAPLPEAPFQSVQSVGNVTPAKVGAQSIGVGLVPGFRRDDDTKKPALRSPEMRKTVRAKTSPAPAPVILSPPTSMAPPPAPMIPLPPEPPSPQEWKGNNDSSIARSGQIVVQNDEQWIRFWAEHHPHEAAPEVDFSQRMVVGVFLGQRPADGFKVHIQGVRTLPECRPKNRP